MADIPKTPMMLITGSLGSGKTTLLRRILDSAAPNRGQPPALQAGNPAAGPAARIAVLMNEFGELAIDSRVISGKNIDIIELAGGCVCCSMTGEFESAVREIIETVGPDYIVVEATGVAESDALVFEVEDNLPEVRLDSVVCIVDAYLGTRHPYVGYTSRSQIASADIILINKVDLVTPAEAQTVEAGVAQYNDRAAFLRTVKCGVDANLLFGQTSRHRGGSLFPASEDKFDSFAWTSEKSLDKTKFDELVGELPQELIRAKGFVRFEEGGRLFNYVVGRADFEEFDVAGTELVFIGRNLDRLRPEIENRLNECRV
ncbi:MAG TPA: GTP-binding protein [Syntrophobacteraceae bacterium]|nr:GTP-binding protein [Syntrophobacteraceae bacterium]